MQECNHCWTKKELSEFNKGNRPNGTSYMCKACRKVYRDRTKEKTKDTQLRLKFGISLVTYREMLKAQNEQCLICGNGCPTGRSLAVDHCHATGRVRGLLCTPCNQGLGSFKDNPELLTTAIQYLKKYN